MNIDQIIMKCFKQYPEMEAHSICLKNGKGVSVSVWCFMSMKVIKSRSKKQDRKYRHVKDLGFNFE